jgi:hypothetical protein
MLMACVSMMKKSDDVMVMTMRVSWSILRIGDTF